MRDGYLRDQFPSDIHTSAIEKELANHDETKDAIHKEFAETVAMCRALMERMELDEQETVPVGEGRGEEATRRPIHPLEECISGLNGRKQGWEEAWEHRKQTLDHWQELGDYEYQVLAVSLLLVMFTIAVHSY